MNFIIIFETQAGTTQFVASLIQKHLQKLGHSADLHQPTLDGEPQLEKYDGLIIGAPTYHHGQIEFTLANFLAEFEPDLSQKQVAAYGLGESMYDEFCTSADLLQEWLISRGGKPPVTPLKIDGYPDDLQLLNQWVEGFLAGQEVPKTRAAATGAS